MVRLLLALLSSLIVRRLSALDGNVGPQLLVRIVRGGRPKADGHLGEDCAEGRLVGSGGTDVNPAAVLSAADPPDESGPLQSVKH